MFWHDLKLRRAHHHLDELKAEIDRWLHVDGCSITTKPDPKPPHYAVSVEVLRPLDEEALGLLIGDCLQNARTALNYLAHTLGEMGAGWGGMSEAESAESAFPIIGDERDGFSGRGPDLFAGAAARQLRTVTPEARAFIERTQPFQQAPAWEYDPLWKLNELARIERHRVLHLAVVRSGRIGVDPAHSSNLKIERLEAESGEVFIKTLTGNPEDEDSAELARVTAHPADTNREMNMHFRDALTIGWDQDTPASPGLDFESVTETLSSILGGVSLVLMKAGPFLKWPDPPSASSELQL